MSYLGSPEHEPIKVGYYEGEVCFIECRCGDDIIGSTWLETGRNYDEHLFAIEAIAEDAP